MNIQKILLIFILVSGTLLIIGSVVPNEPTDNPVNNIASMVNQSTFNQNQEVQTPKTPLKVNQTTINQNESGTNQNPENQDEQNHDLINLKVENQIPAIQNVEDQNSSTENQTPTLTPSPPTVKRELDRLTPIPYERLFSPVVNRIIENQTDKQQAPDDQNSSTNQTPTLSPDDPGAKAEFNRIAATQYDVQNYNCLNKTIDFHNYILQHGAQDTHLVWVKHQSGDYMHIFLVWNDLVYDPTIKPPCYGVNYDKYINAIKKQGFTTVIKR